MWKALAGFIAGLALFGILGWTQGGELMFREVVSPGGSCGAQRATSVAD
jgi:hypothetical protein